MQKKEKMTYKLLPDWVINQSGQSLIISGGADARYEIELETDTSSFFASLKHSDSFRRSDLTSSDQRILEELATAEVIAPVFQKRKHIKIALFGNYKKLSFQDHQDVSVVNTTQLHDVALIVRTNDTYAELLDRVSYQSILVPHLFIDMAFHHTVSIGPLVFPGETACIACLQGRITTRWGDDTPPPTPKSVSDYSELCSELVIAELARISQGDTSLTNKTISWNFQDRSVKQNQLLKVPLCPICSQNKIDQNGALALPWDKQ